MELLTKIVITIIVVLVGAKSLYWTWTSQIDLKASILKFVTQEPKIADSVLVRKPNKLYQNGLALKKIKIY